MFNQVTIRLRFSWVLTGLFLTLAGIVEYWLTLLDINPDWFWTATCILFAYTLYILGEYAWQCWPNSIVRCQFAIGAKNNLDVWVWRRNGQSRKVEVAEDTLITSPLSVIVLQDRLFAKKVLLTIDNCDPGEFRKLRLLVRMHPGFKLEED